MWCITGPKSIDQEFNRSARDVRACSVRHVIHVLYILLFVRESLRKTKLFRTCQACQFKVLKSCRIYFNRPQLRSLPPKRQNSPRKVTRYIDHFIVFLYSSPVIFTISCNHNVCYFLHN